ncbi:Soluble guanylate cyclase 88E [Folsomia candida]|uniref:guanylate cyclase n=1 Tax=Folsomia candida TaxID=158441 RepID=A0A226DF52_FOLCA|nr:Soluble guanylate cyclase 88E [Folsomia candida]
MYGILLENLAEFIRDRWGSGKWESVRRHAGVDTVAFSTHHVYSETLLQRLSKSACLILAVNEQEFFEGLGVYFVQYVSQWYDKVLSVLGRQLRDFLNGLDNLHEYLKFSYPKMRAPSFYCDQETATGLKLHYRTKRRGGLIFYVVGQIKQVALQYYNQECAITLVSEEMDGDTLHVVFDLAFDNHAFTEVMQSSDDCVGNDFEIPISSLKFEELFPFLIIFSSDMEIKHIGHALNLVLKDLVGQIMTESFDLTRPMVPFCFNEIMQRRNNIFELVTIAPIQSNPNLVDTARLRMDNLDWNEATEGIRIRLRGQMLHIPENNTMLYLANPVMKDIGALMSAGLYINDFALHDCSRDLMLAGTQQSVELKLALDQEQQKSKKLRESVKSLDNLIKRTDELLYQMIPKQVADRLRNGENPVDTCETFESVSILFSDVVRFTDICSRLTPMQVVNMLNQMYSYFDQLTEINGVYKVETIGDSYMVVAGAPVQSLNHHERCCDMALDMVDACDAISDPSEIGTSIQIRVGIHVGNIAGGIVGIKMTRWCLFGDTVNIASRMESTSEPSRIQISEACKVLLPNTYECEPRGTVLVKGKDDAETLDTKSIPNLPLEKLRRSREIVQKASSISYGGNRANFNRFWKQMSIPVSTCTNFRFGNSTEDDETGELFSPPRDRFSDCPAVDCTCNNSELFVQNLELALKNPKLIEQCVFPLVQRSVKEILNLGQANDENDDVDVLQQENKALVERDNLETFDPLEFRNIVQIRNASMSNSKINHRYKKSCGTRNCCFPRIGKCHPGTDVVSSTTSQNYTKEQ